MMFHVSYSVLYPWSQGNWDEAVARYLKQEIVPTQAMVEGKIFHKSWEQETQTTGKLPAIFGAGDLSNPVPELRLTVYLDEWIELTGVIDCLEDGIIHEYKTGSSDALTYSRTPQTRVYQLMAHLSGRPAKKAVIHHYNQINQEVTTSHRFLTDLSLQWAKDWVVTNASEMYDALTKNKII